MARWWLLGSVPLVALACSSTGSSGGSSPSSGPDGQPTSDVPPGAGYDASALPPPPPGADAGETWHAVVSAPLAADQVLYAFSDVHGGYDRLAALLAAVGVTAGVPASPSAIQWAAGKGVVVVAGDLIDKGPQPLEVIDALRALETGAAAAGGRVIVLLGNHEAEFFVDPMNSKATGTDGVDVELASAGIDPKLVATGAEPRGAWLRARPLGAKVGDWFFSHAGNTKGRTLAQLDAALTAAIANHPDYNDPEIVGTDSILEARDWYTGTALVSGNAQALGVAHIVFGHDPNALGTKGSIATAQSGTLMRIDCGMSPDVNDSTGCVLRVRRQGADEVAEQVTATGATKTVFQGPPIP